MGKNKTTTFQAPVIDDGRVTIPIEFREAHGIVKGDHLTLKLVKNHGNPYKERKEAPA